MNKAKSNKRPDIVVIGAQKAGTSWLYELLGQREDIWTPPVKELHFFDHKFLPEVREWTTQHIHKGIVVARSGYKKRLGYIPEEISRYLDDLESGPLFTGRWYKQAFSIAPNSKRRLDITPEYSMLPLEGIEFMNGFLQPTTQYIYIVREPVARALSHLAMKVSNWKVPPQTEQEWLHAARDPMLRKKAIYSEFIPRWKSVVGGRLMVISYSELRQDPISFLRQIESFLGLPPLKYHRPERVVKRTPEVEIPEIVREHLKRTLQDQSDYVHSELGLEG